MTKKELIKLAGNEEAMGYLLRIKDTLGNQSSKTMYEKKWDKKEMENRAQEIINLIG